MTRSGFQLAQVNIGRALGAMDEPVMAGFVAQLVTINAWPTGVRDSSGDCRRRTATRLPSAPTTTIAS